MRSEHKSSDRPASDQTSSGVQSDVSLPDSPQRRPSGDRGHVTGAVPTDTVSRDGQLLHSAATVLSRQLDTQLKMQPTVAAPQLTAQVTVPVTAQVTAQEPPSQPQSQPKNEPAAVSALEAAILSQVQQSIDVDPSCGDPPQPSAVQGAPAASGADVTDAPVAADDSSEGDSPEREIIDDDAEDAESCDSFVYEDKSLGDPAASTSPPPGDFLDTGAVPPASDSTGETSRKSSCTSQVSEVVAEFEDEPVAPCAFTDLSQPVDLRRTVILEETESERDRESSPGSIGSQEKESSEERQVRRSEERLEEHSGKLQQRCIEETAVKEPVVEDIVLATAAIEVCAVADVNLPSKEGSLIEGPVGPRSTAHTVAAPSTETSLPKDTVAPSPVLPGDVAAELSKEAPKAPSSASNVANMESAVEAGAPSAPETVPESTADVSLQPHLAEPAPDTSPPPDEAPSPPSPLSSLSDRSISSAVRGWLKDQSPEAVFVVADDSDDDDDSDLDGDDADWESDADTAAPAATPAAPPKNAQGNPSPVRRSSAGAGERVAIRSKAPAVRLNTAAYYSLGVALDEPVPPPPAVLQLVDLDERAVLTVPLTVPVDGASPAGDSDGSEEVDTGALGTPAPSEPPRASLAQELLQVGSLHRASDRQLIGDSALFSATAAAGSSSGPKAVVCPEAGAEAEEADEGYGGSPLASPEARPRPRGLPPHPLHHLGAETPAPWGVCCSLQ